MSSAAAKQKILIVGGGFGGVKAALELSQDDKVTVTLLSDQLNFRYYPALYHTATGGMHRQSSIPLKTIVDEQRVQLVQGTAKTLNREQQTIATTDGQVYHYDMLVLALGVVTNFFGIKGLEEYSYGIKSWEQIQRFKQHLHKQLDDDRKPDLNYVIVGAGPTGIELAGALPAYLHQIMKNHAVRDRKVHIEVIEAAPRLLPRSNEKVSRAVATRLKQLGVELKLGQAVQGETSDSLMVNGQPLPSHTVVWTAGTSNHPFFTANHFAMAEHGKVQVDEYLRAEDNIYVIGDNAGTQFSGLAQTAVRDGRFVARDILRRSKHQPPDAYHPVSPVTVIPVGEGWAAVQWHNSSMAGRLGWLLRAAADWIAFHDIEPWWRASAQWLTEFGTEEDCPTCATSLNEKSES